MSAEGLLGAKTGPRKFACKSEPLLWTPKGAVVRLNYDGLRQRTCQRATSAVIQIGNGKAQRTRPEHREARSAGISPASLATQIFPPFLVAGLGMVAAGLLLSKVREWDIFVNVSEMMILVPALLGLKGNLEMTLASRLSTHANLGDLDGGGQNVWTIVKSNLAAVQCQAIIVGAAAAAVAFSFDMSTHGVYHPGHPTIMLASAITSASVASSALALVMIGIVILARKVGVDPDNIAGPIAGMLGDCCTLGLLAVISQGYWAIHEKHLLTMQCIVVGYFALAPVMAWQARRHPTTGAVLVEGWKPVILSMFISSLGGVILRHAVARFHFLAAFAPVMNGAGGNLAAVQAARLSTDLHAHGHPGVMPPSPRTSEEDEPLTPRGTFTDLLSKTNDHSAVARVLIGLAVPGALVFVVLIVGIRSNFEHLPEPAFVLIYCCATVFQVCFLLVFAHGIVGNLWMGFVNPDNAAIPYVTSVGDVVGTTCLTLAFVACAFLGVAPFAGAVITVASS